MASYEKALASLGEYRMALMQALHSEDHEAGMQVMRAQGATAAYATPLTNVHATGVGLRVRDGVIDPDEFCIKVYVFEKKDLGKKAPKITAADFGDVGVDVEHLPYQQALKKSNKKKSRKKSKSASTTPDEHRERRRPVVGGLQISPIGAGFVGTLGCFVERNGQFFVLSNNHVLADTNALPIGTEIVQPFGNRSRDVFAQLTDFEPIEFSTRRNRSPRNRMDAAIALVDPAKVKLKKMFGISNYKPKALCPVPGMKVTKSGRTTGVTTGMIVATNVSGVGVNFADRGDPPLIGIFDNCVTISGDSGQFSQPGDSGSIILDRDTGRPVALLFAGDGFTTTASDLGEILTRFNVTPA